MKLKYLPAFLFSFSVMFAALYIFYGNKSFTDDEVYVQGEVITEKVLYTVNYELNGGINNEENVESFYGTYTLLNPTLDGYTFAGWYREAEFVTPIENISRENITVYAKWEKTLYKISYELDGGTNGKNPESYYTDVNKITLKNPTKNGYAFAGWYLDQDFKNKVTSIKENSSGDITLYAKWDNSVYNIYYELNGGVNNSNPTSYVAGSGAELKNPTKEGYTFGGWYNNSSLTSKITYISKSSIGNVTLYAKWYIPTQASTSYNTIGWDITGLSFYQKNKGAYKEDCAITSITLQRALKQGIKDSASIENIYQEVWKSNGSQAYIRSWDSQGERPVSLSAGLATVYENLKNAPVIVQRSGGVGLHYSIIYAYVGDPNKLEKSGFKVYDVSEWYNKNLPNDLVSWSNYKGAHLNRYLVMK